MLFFDGTLLSRYILYCVSYIFEILDFKISNEQLIINFWIYSVYTDLISNQSKRILFLFSLNIVKRQKNNKQFIKTESSKLNLNSSKISSLKYYTDKHQKQ